MSRESCKIPEFAATIRELMVRIQFAQVVSRARIGCIGPRGTVRLRWALEFRFERI
jgi:hypothetical protein